MRANYPLAASLIFVIAVTLFPVVTAEPGGELDLFVGIGDSSPEDFAFNLILFVPIGIAAAARMGSRTAERSVAAAIILGAGSLSYALEATQTLLPGRFPSLLDVTANTLGTAAGICLFQLWRAGRRGVILFSFVAVALAMSLLLVRATRLNWNTEYPLVVGNEQTGDRPWMGRLWYIALMDGAASSTELRSIINARGDIQSGVARVTGGTALALYDFAPSRGCEDAAQQLAALVATDGGPCAGDGDGIRVGPDRWLHTAGSAARASGAIRRTDQFTLIVRLASSSVHQMGPARIVSISAGPDLRNFTLAQDNADFVVRLRTPLTGPNGVRVPLVANGKVVPGRAQFVAVTYDGSRLSLFVDDDEPAAAVNFGPGLTLAAHLMPPSMLPAVLEVVPFEEIYTTVLFALLGIAAAWLMPERADMLERDKRLLIGLLSTPLILEALLHVTSGGRLNWVRVGLGVASLLIALRGFRFWRPGSPADFLPQVGDLSSRAN